MEEITMDMALATVYKLMDEIEDAKRIEYLKNLDHETLVDATNCLMNFYKMGLLIGRIMGMVQDGILSDDEYELAILKTRALYFSDGRDFRLQRRLVMDWEYFQENDIEKEV